VGLAAVLGFVTASCGSSSSKPADGGGTGTGGGAGTGGAIGTGGAGLARDGGADVTRGTGGAGGGSILAATLGKACTTDFDCTIGLVCLTANHTDFFGLGGPAHGYCSTSCATAGDQKCADIGGVCADVSNAGDGSLYACLQSCVLGSAPDSKCHARADVACTPTTNDQASTEGECTPTCSSNSECPAGTNCNFGVCIALNAMIPATDPTGTHCTPAPAGQADSCGGSAICLTLTVAGVPKNVCSRACVLGSSSACDFVDATMSLGTTPHAICLGTLTANPSAGDIGFCIQQCDAVSNCLDQVDTGAICDMTDPTIPHGACSWM
jgi:hypothetical protein